MENNIDSKDKTKQLRENLLFAMVPGGIVSQERIEQHKMCCMQVLPKKTVDSQDSRDMLEQLCVEIIRDYDNLFYSVILPKGWTLVPTDHKYHTLLCNDNGEAVARIFYKAAFYDRKADIRKV